MRKLLIPLLASLLLPTAVYAWWGKYNSQIEAKEACNKWKLNGFKFTLDKYSLYLKRTIATEIDNRWCRHEDSTRQYLGYERKGKRGQHYTQNEYKNLNSKDVIKKYFRY